MRQQSSLRKKLYYPGTQDIDINAIETISVHRKIIFSKPLLNAVYRDWYKRFLPSVEGTLSLSLPMIEIGCGSSFLEQYIPTIIKTDLVNHSNVDRVMSGERIDYPSNGLRAIFMVGVLHHMKNPELFFQQVARTLAPGGRLVMIEPSNSPLHQYLTNRFNRYEYYDGSISTWENRPTGRMSNVNNAIPWVIFGRDRKLFEERFPQLKVRKIQKHTLLNYYLSGGLAYRAFLPESCKGLVAAMEALFKPIQPWLGSMMTIELEKE